MIADNKDFRIERLPDGQLALWKYYGDEEEVVIPYGVTTICFEAFQYKRMVKVKIPDSVKDIGNAAFKACAYLESVTLPRSLTSISDSAFMECLSLKHVDIPEGVTEIGYQAFAGCARLESIELPERLSILGDEAFSYCKRLKSIRIPGSVTEIRRSAFEGCGELHTVILEEGVKAIDGMAFASCYKLDSLRLPDSIIDVDWNIFRLTEVLDDPFGQVIPPPYPALYVKDFTILPSHLWFNALLGYALSDGDPDSERGKDYAGLVRHCADEVLSKAIYDMPLLNFACKVKGINPKSIARYIELAQKQNLVEQVAMLIQYQIGNTRINELEYEIISKLGISPDSLKADGD